MTALLALLSILLLLAMVFARVVMLGLLGIRSLYFASLDKKDLLILPFVGFYILLVFARAVGLPILGSQLLFVSEPAAWIGVIFCLAGLALMLWSLISFGRSYRIGIDAETPGALMTTGAFAFSRNPIYTAIALIFLGQFLVYPNWVMLVYLLAAAWLFHRQVLREEAFLKVHYGQAYAEYCSRVGRYF